MRRLAAAFGIAPSLAVERLLLVAALALLWLVARYDSVPAVARRVHWSAFAIQAAGVAALLLVPTRGVPALVPTGLAVGAAVLVGGRGLRSPVPGRTSGDTGSSTAGCRESTAARSRSMAISGTIPEPPAISSSGPPVAADHTK